MREHPLKARRNPPGDTRLRPSIPSRWRDIRIVSRCERFEIGNGNIYASGVDDSSVLWPVVSPIVADLLFRPTTLPLASEVMRLAKQHETSTDEAVDVIVAYLPTLESLGLVDVTSHEE